MARTTCAKAIVWILVLTLGASPCKATGANEPAGRLVLPPLEKAPTIDGDVRVGEEWYQAAQVYGFVTHDRGVAEPRWGYVMVGFDRTHLYFGVVTVAPPKGSLVQTQTMRDSPVVTDDAIEIFIDPHRAGAYRERKIYQFMGNPRGTIYDRALSANGKGGDESWNGNWKFASRIEKDVWTAEVAIALKDIGATYDDLRRGIGFFVGRDWKQPAVFSGITQYGFMRVKSYPVLVADEEAPVIRVKRLGYLNHNKLNLYVSFHNKLARPQKLKVQLRVESSNLPARKDTKIIELAPRGGNRYQYKFDNTIDTDNQVSLRVTSADGAKVFFERTVKYRHVTDRPWNTKEALQGPIGFDIAYYPSLRKLKARVRTEGIPPEAKLESVAISVFSPAGKKIAAGSITKFEKRRGETVIDLPRLDDGTYKVVAKPLGAGVPKVTASATFLRKHFVWEGNTLGISDEVFPLFTPLEVNGREIACVLRRYKANAFGLWDRVTAKGKQLLAAPMTVVATAEGAKLPWTKLETRVAEAKPSRVVVKGTAENERVKLATTSTYDIDGCMKVEMTVASGGAGPIDTMTVEIPLENSLVSLYHVNADRIRHNPAGAVPKGEGVIFDGMKLRRRYTLGSFLNYIWVGGTERGIAWFADNDKGWVIDDAKPSVTLTRSGSVLCLRIHLVRKRTALEHPRKIVFGLIASPVKPMPEDWRRWTWPVPYKDYPSLRWLFYSGETAPAPYPYKYQTEFWDGWKKARETGRMPKEYMARWLKQFEGWEEYRSFYKPHVAAFFYAATKKPTMFMPCLDSYEFGRVHPEFHVFQDEWDLKQYRNRNCISRVRTRADRHDVVTVDPVRSYTDFTVYWCNEQMKRGMGQYLDNNFPHTNFDPLVSDAYVRPDGKVQGAGRIWHMRARIRRLAALQHKHGVRGLMCHVTNGHLLPVLSFAQASLDWEWKYGNAPFPERFAADLIRAETIGLQSGCVPFVLSGIKDYASEEEAKELTRQLWGVATVHEVKTTDYGKDKKWFSKMETKRFDFGYGLADCKVLRYWDPKPAVKIAGKQIYWIAYARRGKAMLILASYEPKPVQAEITLDRTALGLPWRLHLADAELDADKPLSTTDTGRFAVPLKKYGVRMLLVY